MRQEKGAIFRTLDDVLFMKFCTNIYSDYHISIQSAKICEKHTQTLALILRIFWLWTHVWFILFRYLLTMTINSEVPLEKYKFDILEQCISNTCLIYDRKMWSRQWIKMMKEFIICFHLVAFKFNCFWSNWLSKFKRLHTRIVFILKH